MQTQASAKQARVVKSSRPNILLLIADQLRADYLGAYGNRIAHTPNIDRLSTEGVRFNCAYTSTPSCTPARSALLTGLSPWHHGMLGMTAMAASYPLEMPRALGAAGYYTTVIGKNHFYPIRNSHGYHQMILDEHCSYWFDKKENDLAAPASDEERCDYEAWFWSQLPCGNPHATGLSWNDYRGKPFVLPERLHATAWTGDTAVNFLRSYQRQDPFFLKVSFIRPHSPYDPPARCMDPFKDADIPEPFKAKWSERYAPRSGPDNEIWHGALPTDTVRQSRQAYHGSVTFVDEQIGRILDTLEKRGMLDDTLIIFMSDHGDMLGDHNLWRKTYAYEPSAHIPMLMRWPAGLPSGSRGQVRNEPVEIRDILPTVLEASGTESHRDIDGRSLLSLVRNGGADWRKWIDLEHNICYAPQNHWSGLSDGKWKYIFHAMDGEEQLFHLETDPQELTDLASEANHASELKAWRNRLVEHLSERGDAFVKNGNLALRPSGMMTSPHFPGYADYGKPRRNPVRARKS
jgi:arylsulfatase